jgi:hypothetical protein
MKKLLSLLSTAVLALGLHLPTVAQVVNGDFEINNQQPQGRINIASTPYNGPSDYDDLPNWLGVHGTPDYLNGSTRVGVANTLINNDDPAAPYAPYIARSGEGCVKLAATAYLTDRSHDERITQEISGLTPNRVYVAQFYVRRRPTTYFTRKLSLAVHTAIPQYSGSTPSTPPYKQIISDYVVDIDNWTLVSGEFVAPSASCWISIGYDDSDPVVDTSIAYSPQPGGQYTLEYIIDDVSVVEKVCPVPDAPVVTQEDPALWNCGFLGSFTIDNFDPSLTYTLTLGPKLSASSLQPTSSTFLLRTSADSPGTYTVPLYRYFTLTATNACQVSATTTNIPADFVCDPYSHDLAAVGAKMAYPNPSSESLTVPMGATGGVLLNSQGRVVQRTDNAGKLDVRQLPAGLYNLQMQQNGKQVNQRIEVTH